MTKPIGDTSQLTTAGFTPEEITLCNERYTASPFTNYSYWCRVYIALNSTKEQDSDGLVLDGNLIIKALSANKKKPALTKQKGRLHIGSYKRK